MWSLNNYLGLANHPEVRKADAEGAIVYGLASPMGARMMSGNSNYHEQLEKELAEFFLEYLWPGNVRELKHTIEYMMNITSGTKLTVKDLPAMLKQNAVQTNNGNSKTGSLALKNNLDETEKCLIKKALSITDGNINQAAKLLDIPRQTLQYKLKKYLEL